MVSERPRPNTLLIRGLQAQHQNHFNNTLAWIFLNKGGGGGSLGKQHGVLAAGILGGGGQTEKYTPLFITKLDLI